MSRVANDGLPARVSGTWTQEKLTYLSKYADAFMTAMAPKRRSQRWSELVYIDLLCGPGRGIDRGSGNEFDGSPLRALRIRPPYDRLFFSDLSNRNVETLRKRIPVSDINRVTLQSGDCHEVATRLVKGLPPRSLGLAFVDPEGFEGRFSLFETLAARRIDVLFLFPGGIGIRRNLAKFARQGSSPMDRFWGDRSWRELPRAKLAAGRRLDSDDVLTLDRPWVLAFRAKMMHLGFIHQDEADPFLKNEKNAPMYHLLFFSKAEAGLTLWRGIKKIAPSGQRSLF
ncbi:MAG TPA: three-Cys-motif partner protein TcmP [Patescibacteria group bacterium]|nr:three-Cys-motif partner protein TcmP [Patescibacteria group bacterium]